jgi:hypothetical protein
MAMNAAGSAEFFHEILHFSAVTGFPLYLVSCVILFSPSAREFFGARSAEEIKPRGKGFCVLALALCSFCFALGWTDLSSALDLVSKHDYRGVAASLVFVVTGLACAAVVLRIWWHGNSRDLFRVIWLLTGWVLLEHAICYSAITALVYAGGEPLMRSAVSSAGLVIVGRFIFAAGALAIAALLRGSALWNLPRRSDFAMGPWTLSGAQRVLDDLRGSPASKIKRAVRIVAKLSTDERDINRLIHTFFMNDYDLKRETAQSLGSMLRGKGMTRGVIMRLSDMMSDEGQQFLLARDSQLGVLSSVRKALWRELYVRETDNHPAYKDALDQALEAIFGVQHSIPLPNDLFDEEYMNAKRAFEKG